MDSNDTLFASPSLLHMGGPPHCPFNWNGLASNTVIPQRDGAGRITSDPRPVYQSSALAPATHGWLTVWAQRRWLKGIPSCEGTQATVCARLDQYGQQLVQHQVLQAVTLMSEAKPSAGLIKTIDDDWLLWTLKAKSIGHVWMVDRSARLSRTGSRCVNSPRPAGEEDLSSAQQTPIWIHLRIDALGALESLLAQWKQATRPGGPR